MNEDFRYEFLDGCRDAALSELVTAVINQYLPMIAGMYVISTCTLPLTACLAAHFNLLIFTEFTDASMPSQTILA